MNWGTNGGLHDLGDVFNLISSAMPLCGMIEYRAISSFHNTSR